MSSPDDILLRAIVVQLLEEGGGKLNLDNDKLKDAIGAPTPEAAAKRWARLKKKLLEEPGDTVPATPKKAKQAASASKGSGPKTPKSKTEDRKNVSPKKRKIEDVSEVDEE